MMGGNGAIYTLFAVSSEYLEICKNVNIPLNHSEIPNSCHIVVAVELSGNPR